MTALSWVTSASADDAAHDQEADLTALGSPGGAARASVSPERGGWRWAVYSRWLWEDIDSDPAATLAEGTSDTEELAKEAVALWAGSTTA